MFSFNFSRETRFGNAPVMCRMRETDNGSVPAERFGPYMARRVRALLRLQNHATGQVFLQGSEALLQKRLLQVSARPRSLHGKRNLLNLSTITQLRLIIAQLVIERRKIKICSILCAIKNNGKILTEFNREIFKSYGNFAFSKI